MNINSKKKYYIYIDRLLASVVFVLSLFCISVLFYKQATTTGERWQSDIISYIEEITGHNKTYPYPYPIMFMVGRMINTIIASPEMAITLTGVVFIGLSMIITKIVIEKETDAPYFATIATFGLHFVSMIYGDVFDNFGIFTRNTGVFTPNPWYNLTYMAARPFMIMAFVLACSTLKNYENDLVDFSFNRTKIKYVLFAVCMLLVTMTKPSYTIVHMGAAGLIMLYRLIISRGSIFKQTIGLGLCYLPTIIDLLYQYLSEFTGGPMVGDEQGIGADLFTVWDHFSDNIPLAILLAGAFPIITLILHIKDLKYDVQFRFAWGIYIVGLAMAAIFYEEGYTKYHCNFFWGYECGLFLVFLCGIIKTIADTLNCIKKPSKQLVTLSLVQWLVFIVHVAMGLNYFYILTIFGANPS